MKFLTGDRKFEGLGNVEFIKCSLVKGKALLDLNAFL